ncbi:hypothetical protein M0R72_14550 [Candidatus Pacearchaeota archaeon]|jgi:hypothetical protein|nr:hypothetical protein [Candidatus Pacearchaeota archaeon]
MNVKIKRSESYCKAQTIATGRNVPECVVAKIDPASLAVGTRTRIIEWWGGSYPDDLSAIDVYQNGRIHAWSGSGQRAVAADIEVEGLTSEMVDAHIESLAAEADAKRTAYLASVEEQWEAFERDGVGVFMQPAAIPARQHECGIDHLDGYEVAQKLSDALQDLHPDVWSLAIAERDRRNQEITERAKDAYQEQKALEAEQAKAVKARKYAQLTEAVQRLGTEEQRDRWSEGLMSPREAVALIEQEALAPLADYTLPILASGGVGGPGSLYTSILYLRADEYTALRTIKTALPTATIRLYRVSEDVTDDDDGTLMKFRWTVAEVQMTVGEIEIIRDVVLRSWTVDDCD